MTEQEEFEFRARLEAEANPTKAVNQQAAKEVSAFDYIANQAKLGLTDTATLGEAILDTFLINPAKSTYAAVTGKGEVDQGSLVDRFSKNYKKLKESANVVTGAEEGMKAPGVVSQIVGSGARFVADPLTLFGSVAKLPARIAGMFTAGAGAEVGGIAGEEVEKYTTGTDTGTGRTVGSLVGALKGVPVAVAAKGAVDTTINAGKQVWDKYKAVKVDPDAAEQALATGAAKNVLELISKEQPEKTLDTILSESNRLGMKIDGNELPLMFSMADNPIVAAEVTRLVKTNPEFRQRVETELQNFATSIDRRANTVFGERYAPVPESAPISVKNAFKRREAIDNQLENIADRFKGVDVEEQGKAISNLVRAREEAVRAEIAPDYENVLTSARKAGAKLPEGDVANIYNFVVANNVRDIFGKGTPLDKKIMSALQPDATGFSPMSFDNVESLKRSINELQRTVKDPQQLLKINQLEEVLNAGRQNIKGNFSDQLAAVDRKFYEKVGVPFSAQGIKEIDSRKYAEQVAPIIAKNASATRQFLNVAGEAGQPIVRNSVIAEAYKSAVTTDGVLNPRALQKYIKDKSAVIDQVPNLKAELQKSVLDDSFLRLEKSRLDDSLAAAQRRISDNIFPQLGMSKEAPDYQSVISRMGRDTTYRAKVFKDLKDLDPNTSAAVRKRLQAELVEVARNDPKGAVSFFENERNKALVDSLMGSGYAKEAKDIAKLADMYRAADIGKFAADVQKSQMDSVGKTLAGFGLPGLDLPTITSQLRDRIASTPQKIVRLATRVNTAKLQDATDEALMSLFLDKNGRAKLLNTARSMDFKIKNPVQYKKMQDTFNDVLPRYFYAGVRVGMEEPQRQQAEMPEFGSFETPSFKEPQSKNDLQGLVSATIQEKNVPPELARVIPAVIQTESGWNTNAKSKTSSAAGLFQMTNAARKDVNIPKNATVKQDIEGGIDYLLKQYRKYGDVSKALHAYNQGHYNPRNKEGQSYVASVFRNI